MTTLTIPARFNGPPASANGGVTCGLLAAATGLAEVTLRQPPPLDVPLELRDAGLYDGDLLVAQATAGTPDVALPRTVTVEEARVASTRYAGQVGHPFPTCFVCGPEHPTGLHLFPGEVEAGVVACPWTPADDDPLMAWAALDCPGGWSVDIVGRPMVLGRMALRLDRRPEPGVEHVVVGWHRRTDGRKVLTASALLDPAGAVLAVAEQTWITLAP